MNVLENVCMQIKITGFKHIVLPTRNIFSDKMLKDFFPPQVSQILSELMWKIRLIFIRLGYPNLDVQILPS